MDWGERIAHFINQRRRAATVSEQIEESGSRKKLCLIVDDSPMIRKIARRFLSEFGFDVDEAENGQTGVDKCLGRLPEIVLLDWNMPVMNGIEFLRALRRMPNGDRPSVILCTTEADVSHINEAYEAGTNEYLVKPFDRSSLWSKLSRFA
jgi:two-component system chemotaxis response regulator CheY